VLFGEMNRGLVLCRFDAYVQCILVT